MSMASGMMKSQVPNEHGQWYDEVSGTQNKWILKIRAYFHNTQGQIDSDTIVGFYIQWSCQRILPKLNEFSIM